MTAIAQTEMEREVFGILESMAEPGYPVDAIARDVTEHGCTNGIVGKMIYLKDTIPFYERHKQEIWQRVVDCLDEGGLGGPAELFPSWDNNDLAALQTSNQNLLAWFGFEAACESILAQMERDEQ